MPMLAVTTRSFAPGMRPPTCGAAWRRALKTSAPAATPAAAAPTRVANSRRVMPSWLFPVSATLRLAFNAQDTAASRARGEDFLGRENWYDHCKWALDSWPREVASPPGPPGQLAWIVLPLLRPQRQQHIHARGAQGRYQRRDDRCGDEHRCRARHRPGARQPHVLE